MSSNDNVLGFVSTNKIEENLKQEIEETTDKNIDEIFSDMNLEYEFMLVNKNIDTIDNELETMIEENLIVTYTYFEIALNDIVINKVDTFEEAEELIFEVNEQISEEDKDLVNLSITQNYADDIYEIDTSEIEIAKLEIIENCNAAIEVEKEIIAKEEWLASLPEISGIKISNTTPVDGYITSRYATYSRLRVSTHTGLDIGATEGTDISVIADGVVTYAAYNGSYGNLVKIDHGNGVESWYAHTSQMYVEVGDTVLSGDIIAAVGSTGNSTGSHLHIEIRVNDVTVDPEEYLSY